MATAAGDLIVRLGAQTTQFDRRMQMARGQVVSTGVATARMGRMMAGGFGAAATGARALTAALVPLIAPLLGIYGALRIGRAGEEFNRKMRQSLAIMGDLSEMMRKDMRRAAFDVAKSTRFAAAEAAEAYYFLVSAGLSAAQSIGAIPTVAKFAQAGNFDLARATDILTDAQSALGLASQNTTEHMENMARVGDVTVAAAKKANASVEQFGEALMNKGALGAKLVGMELEEATAILMVFADKGFAKGVEGGSALWMALRDLKTKAVENKAAFKRLGIEVDAGGGRFGRMADIVEDLDRAFAGLEPLEIQKKLAALGLPSKSLAPILTLLGTADQLRNYQQYLEQAGGTMKEVADKQLTPLQKGWAKLGSTITKVGADILQTIGPTLETALTAVANYVTGAWETIKFGVQNAGDLSKLALIELALKVLELVPQVEGPLAKVSEVFAGVFAGIGAFARTIIDNIIGGFKELMNVARAVGSAIREGFRAIAEGDIRNAASRMADTFIETFARQQNVQAPNAFKEFHKAYNKAAGDVRRRFARSGGLKASLEDERQRLLEQIAGRDLKAAAPLTIAAGGPAAAAAGGAGAGAGAGVGMGGKMFAGAAEKGSKEAWNRIATAMGAGKKGPMDAIAKATKESAKDNKRAADSLDRLEDNEGGLTEIPR